MFVLLKFGEPPWQFRSYRGIADVISPNVKWRFLDFALKSTSAGYSTAMTVVVRRNRIFRCAFYISSLSEKGDETWLLLQRHLLQGPLQKDVMLRSIAFQSIALQWERLHFQERIFGYFIRSNETNHTISWRLSSSNGLFIEASFQQYHNTRNLE